MLRKLLNKTIISFIMILILIVSNFNLVVFSAEENSPLILLSKTSVKADEIINVTIANASTNPEAWIGIYNENDVPGGGPTSIVWSYLKDAGIKGGAGSFYFNLSQYSLKAGNVYKVVLFKDGGYTIDATIKFTVISENTPAISMSKTLLGIKDNVNITISNGSTDPNAWVGIYSENKIPGQDGPSIWWSYLKDLEVKSGNGSFNLDVSKCNLQAGNNYKLILFKDEGYIIDSSVNFAINKTQLAISKSQVAPNEKIQIKVEGANNPTTEEDCIGLFEDSSDVSKDKAIWKGMLKESGIIDGNGTVVFDPSTIASDKYTSGKKYKFVLGKNDIYDNNISISFEVLLKSQLKPIVIKTQVGQAPILPVEITAAYNDGTSKMEKVTWDTVSPELYTKARSFTVKGIVNGDSETAKADVTVVEKNGPLFTFEVLSDTHIKADMNDTYDVNFDNALKDIRRIDTTSSGIIIDGDITNGGDLNQWSAFKAILDNNQHSKVNLAFGNHDTWSSDGFNASKNFFTNFNGVSNVYYDYWMNGFHFVFLGGEFSDGNWADLSPEQLKWLDETLAQGEDKNKPIFLFLHQPLQDTVAGSKTSQKWYNVSQDQDVKDILVKYPQTIFFTGHTHWKLGSKDTLYNEKYCTMINVPSVAYCWTDDDTEFDHSQGYFIDVYNNKVLVKGRDFTTGEWSSDAQFTIPYTINTTLSSITIASDAAILDVGKTAQLKNSGLLSSGDNADLATATIEYISSNPEIISIDKNGLMTAKKAGNVTVYSVVTLNCVKVESNKLNITVKGLEENKPIKDLTAAAGDGQATLNYSNPIGALKVDLQYSIDSINYLSITTTSSIKVTTSSAVGKTTTSAISSTNATVTGLTNGQQYSFRLNVIGGSNAGISNVVTVMPMIAAPPVQQSTISQAMVDFDKKVENQADIKVIMTLNGNSLTVIKNGSYTLVNGTDYIINGNIVAIKKSYLANQGAGIVRLVFNFSAGDSQSLTITIKDTTSNNSNDKNSGNSGSSREDRDNPGSNSTSGNSGIGTNTPQTTGEKGKVDVIVAEAVKTVEDGVKKDLVKLDEAKVMEIIKKVVDAKMDAVTILVTNNKDNKADQVEVQVSKKSTDKLAESNIGLKIDSEKADLEIPKETLKNLTGDLKIDIKEVTDASKVNATKGLALQVKAGSEVIGNPVEVETNYTGRTKITIPLKSENLPKDKDELKKLLDSLGVFVEHSDGEKVMQKGEIVYDEKGSPVGISIWVDKFSTFTVVSLPIDNKEVTNTGNEVTATSEVPEIKFVGLGHSPLVEGEKEDFIISSSFNGNVQYRIYLNVNGAWKEVTNGYSATVNGKESFSITPDYKFEKGQYQGRVYVKKAGAKGSKEENGIDFDSYYTYNINCVDRDDENRVYTSGALKINKDTFKAGEKVTITGVEGISGIQGPYVYRLHIYDVANDKWTNNVVPYSEKLEWTPSTAGNYVLDVHIITPNSILWDKVQNHPTLIYGGYEGWKLKTIKVN